MTGGRQLVLVGGGGHASVCLDVARSAGWQVLGYVGSRTELDTEHLGSDDALAALDADRVGVLAAIGDNAKRLALMEHVRSLGLALATAVSSHAVLSPSVRIGEGTVVMPGVIVNARTVIGDGVILNTGATVDHDCRIGDGVHIAPGCHLAGSVEIGGAAMLGVGTTVIPGVSIGTGAIVGAGSCVVRDVPAHTVNIGVPARVTRRLNG
jgi:sugar O-acyltransferase (sialic acid O-acetyltransferase NeuD family)